VVIDVGALTAPQGVSWPYPPQGVFEERLGAAAIVADVGPRATITGRVTEDLVRLFRLRYTVVTTGQADRMWDFYRARHGAFQPFDFINPNDGAVYFVRFANPGLDFENFLPGFWRGGGELAFTVVRS
jgi:hypothetical protein